MRMTEKRFQYNVNKNTIEQDGKFVAYMNSVDGVRIANKLNVFKKENEQLKIRFNEEREKSLKFCRNIDTLTIENEQLKADKQSLIDFIRKEFPKSHKHILEGLE